MEITKSWFCGGSRRPLKGRNGCPSAPMKKEDSIFWDSLAVDFPIFPIFPNPLPPSGSTRYVKRGRERHSFRYLSSFPFLLTQSTTAGISADGETPPSAENTAMTDGISLRSHLPRRRRIGVLCRGPGEEEEEEEEVRDMSL